MPRVFLDANVWFAGCHSLTGASALILELAARRRLHVVTSRVALREAKRNLSAKSPRRALQRFHRLLKAIPVEVVRAPDEEALASYADVIHPHDVPILAAALDAQVDYLVTLDRRHFLTPRVRARAGTVTVLTPGDALKDLIGRGR